MFSQIRKTFRRRAIWFLFYNIMFFVITDAMRDSEAAEPAQENEAVEDPGHLLSAEPDRPLIVEGHASKATNKVSTRCWGSVLDWIDRFMSIITIAVFISALIYVYAAQGVENNLELENVVHYLKVTGILLLICGTIPAVGRNTLIFERCYEDHKPILDNKDVGFRYQRWKPRFFNIKALLFFIALFVGISSLLPEFDVQIGTLVTVMVLLVVGTVGTEIYQYKVFEEVTTFTTPGYSTEEWLEGKRAQCQQKTDQMESRLYDLLHDNSVQRQQYLKEHPFTDTKDDTMENEQFTWKEVKAGARTKEEQELDRLIQAIIRRNERRATWKLIKSEEQDRKRSHDESAQADEKTSPDAPSSSNRGDAMLDGAKYSPRDGSGPDRPPSQDGSEISRPAAGGGHFGAGRLLTNDEEDSPPGQRFLVSPDKDASSPSAPHLLDPPPLEAQRVVTDNGVRRESTM